MPDSVHQRSGHQIYTDLEATPEFHELRHRYRTFAFPYTVAFLVWYLLYVAMSNWADDFMSQKIGGNINVALVFGILQFVSTFGIAYLYSRHAARSLDPLSRELRSRYDREMTKPMTGPEVTK